MAAPITNRAVWQDAAGVPGVVRASPLPGTDAELGDRKVLVKVHAWAVNPCDHMLQDRELGKYPAILGCDVAGTVSAAAAAASSRFRVGDRVFGVAANNGFQDYVALEDRLAAHIPGDMSFRDAVVFGLAGATAAMFLFGDGYLGLDLPGLGAPRKGKSVLVWGGSSAVGGNAVQLAAAAGYDVVATCSRKNFDYVRRLGAVQVFDYKDADVAGKVAGELDKGDCAGIFVAAGSRDGNVAACRIAAASKQGLKLASSGFIGNLGDVPAGVDVRQPTAATFKPFPDAWFETTPATFEGYLPEALSRGAYKVAPPPLVVNRRGLDGIQEAVNFMRVVSGGGLDGIKEAVDRTSEGGRGDGISPVKLVVERP
ncbi:chaperonin 10-like protein [Lasiosphaeria miniovina]|uniref:Chaperonin 10-like protein n=1 Tax=Lasiosphaeria miniovina TaxID=1954250 RepID=A0AA40DU06_9PEZI|nr:chaperonin 10-like protein [Lasiosphaeria miniovina]KAK0713302.1 chaperonin 10-like protein [Lasiosphaeria miniovina]